MSKIDNLIDILTSHIEGSSFKPVEEQLLREVNSLYPGIPKDIEELYKKLGYGCVGESRYMIHALLNPSDIYDLETSKKLDGIIIVGDDFNGNCEAYDAKNGWAFGSIGCDGIFNEYGKDLPSFVDFLKLWFVKSEST